MIGKIQKVNQKQRVSVNVIQQLMENDMNAGRNRKNSQNICKNS